MTITGIGAPDTVALVNRRTSKFTFTTLKAHFVHALVLVRTTKLTGPGVGVDERSERATLFRLRFSVLLCGISHAV